MSNTPIDIIDERWHEIEAGTAGESAELADSTYIERIAYWRDRVSDEYTSRYKRLLDANCAPRVAAGVCQYVAGLEGVTETRSQKEIANEFNISRPTIRNWYEQILSDGR